MLYMKEVEEAKRAAEKALQDELSLKTFAKKGAAGKGQNPKKDQKNKAKSPANDAESASSSDSRFKEQLSHGSNGITSQSFRSGTSFRETAKHSQQRKRQEQQ